MYTMYYMTMYGAERWRMMERDLSRQLAGEMKFLWAIKVKLRKDRGRNLDIRGELKMENTRMS